MARILYGKEVSSALWERLLPRIDRLRAHGVAPTLAIVRVGERPDDLSYERTCARQADLHGIAVRRFVLPTEATQAELEAVIDAVNTDPRIHGCLMFRPLPPQMDERAVCDRLSPAKDIDGIGSASLAGVFADTGEGFPPATAQACLETLDFYDIPVAGKCVVVLGRSLVIGRPVAMMLLARHATVTLAHSRTADVAAHTREADIVVCVVVLGRSLVIGRPVAMMLLARHATVTLAHSRTADVAAHTREADIVVCATGRARAYGAEYFSPGQTVLDVGINFDEAGNLCGDVDFNAVASVLGEDGAITPVPRGLGGVTTSVTMAHVVRAAEVALRR